MIDDTIDRLQEALKAWWCDLVMAYMYKAVDNKRMEVKGVTLNLTQ